MQILFGTPALVLATCFVTLPYVVRELIPVLEAYGEEEELAAVSCAVQNMALTAQALNVGAYWSSPPLIDDLREFLSLDANEKCIGLFYMGYHNEAPSAANRTQMADKVKWMEI